METATARSIIDCALEIIYLLNGEDYRVIQVVSGVCVTPIIQLQKSITQSPPHSTLCQKKILELTSKITQLVTKEVPLRCQDVALYFSMEEWEYVEGHRDQYLDLVVEEHRILTLPDGSRLRNSPERCVDLFYSQDSPEENVLENYQGENLINIKVEVIDEEEETDFMAEQQYRLSVANPSERCPVPLCSQDCSESHQGGDLTIIKVEAEGERMMEDQPCMSDVKEETPGDDTTEYPSKNCEGNQMVSLSCKVEDEDIIQHSPGQSINSLSVYPEPQCTNLLYCSPNSKEPSPDQAQIVTSTGQIGGKGFQCGGKKCTKNPCLLPHKSPKESFLTCAQCGKCFSKKSNLITHERRHTGKTPYSCSECGKYFLDKSHLVIHERIHTGEKPYKCSECGKCFTNKSSLVRHERIHTGEKPYLCSECGKCFTCRSHLVTHQKIHTVEKPYACSQCGNNCTHKSHLVIHERVPTKERPYSCSECGKCFTNKSHLVSHERCHTGEKPYSCSECGKCFSEKTNLVIHERIHTGEKPYSCSECGKCFVQKAHLVTHERIHTGKKLYSCSRCGKSFMDESNLVKHERIHTGEKPYSCSECGKCFMQKVHLVTHERIHTGEKPYSCSHCGKLFIDESNFVKHERIHTGEKPYSCPECGKCFMQKAHLVAHERIHTGEKLHSYSP